MPIYRAEEVGYVLRHSAAVAAVTCEEFRGFGHLAMFEELRSAAPELRALYVARAARHIRRRFAGQPRGGRRAA